MLLSTARIHMREFTLGPLSESRSAPSDLQLAGQHIKNSLARTVVQAPKFQHITPILQSLHWLKVSKRIEYKIISLTKFSILLSLRICMISYLFSLLMVTTHALHLMSLLSNHHQRSKSLTAPSDMLHLIFGTSFLHHSGFLIQIIHPPLSDHHLNMPV